MTLEQLHTLQAQLREVLGYPARIVGGAVRDAILGRPIKDIDVFVEKSREDVGDYDEHNEYEVRELVRKVALAVNGWAVNFAVTSEHGYADGDGRNYATYDVPQSEGQPPINLIFGESETVFLNGFPDTLSQVALSDGGETWWIESDGFAAIRLGSDVVYSRLPEDDARNIRLRLKYGQLNWVFDPLLFMTEGHGIWA